MTRPRAAIAIAVIQVLLVCSLGAKLLYDRHRYPRIWVKTQPIDPSLPVRGRYLSLGLEVKKDFSLTPDEQKRLKVKNSVVYHSARLELRGNELVAVSYDGPGSQPVWLNEGDADSSTVRWPEPVLYFIPEHAEDPSRQPPGSRLWAEVTIPKKGPPRPIQLAVSNASGWHVLNLR
jgi:uncharacterized membrane-anchored protein